jgi:hypothetical protein
VFVRAVSKPPFQRRTAAFGGNGRVTSQVCRGRWG